MATKKKMSPRTKKILLGFGIGGGTILVFLISFFMALYFIINPIVWNDPAILAENRNLRDENETMKEELAELIGSDEDDSAPSGGDSTVVHNDEEDDNDDDKPTQTTPQDNSNSDSGQSTPVTPERPTEITPSGDSNSGNGTSGEDSDDGNGEGEATEEPDGVTTEDGSGEEPDDGTPTFNPETEVTPEGGRPNDGETDVTTIVLD